MRTHAEIIDRPTRFARALDADPNTVKAWKRNNSIPAAHWAKVKRAGLATLEELADAAEIRREPNRAESRQTADARAQVEQDPSKPGSALAFREFMLNSPWADVEIELPKREGGWRDISFLFED